MSRRPYVRRRVRLLTLVAVSATALLTGCRGVPTSSEPQAVSSLGLGQNQGLVIQPQKGAGPREIINQYLIANGVDPVRHSSARAFMTRSEQGVWSDSTAVIVSGAPSVGTYDAARHTLTVTARAIGTLDKNGIYAPTLSGTGLGGERRAFVFGLAQVRGQYRISSVPRGLGLLLTADQFQTGYQTHVLYFFDASDSYLVPDLRYSALADPAEVADWLLGQLATGPRPGLAPAVSTDTLPPHVQSPTVRIGAVTEIRIDGARQLAPATRDRLAAQLGTTLDETVRGELAIVDGNTRVPIPHVNGTQFSAADFPAVQGPPVPAHTIYFLNSEGHIKQGISGTLRGPVASTSFDSIALARPPATHGQLAIAGVRGSRLWVGTQEGGVHVTSLAAQSLTRPAWAPGQSEVWIAAGPNLYRVVTNGKTSKVMRVGLPPGTSVGRIIALRISPDGSRIALVIGTGSEPGGQLVVGSIVRNGSAQIGPLDQVSPEEVRITDVAWADSLKLYATGYLSRTKDARVFETSVDGASWTDLGLSTLPDKPSSITATPGAPAWVDVDGFVWEQNGTAWVSPGPQDQTPGRAPTYLG